MSQLKVVLVGCGRIAQRHAEILTNGSVDSCVLAAVCDKDPSRASDLGGKYNVPSFTDMDLMMNTIDPEIVSVLTESGNHALHTINLSRYGKAVIVEKPMALKVSDAIEMINSCKKHESPLFIVKQNRFNLPIVKLREAVVSGRFGRIFLGTVRVRWCRKSTYYTQDDWRGTWAMDGGVLSNQASHHLDMLLWMLGDVEEVSAVAKTVLAPIEAEDTILVSLIFKSGALGQIEATTATRPKDLEGSISILGERGSVVVGGFAMNEIHEWNFDAPLQDDTTVFEDFSCTPKDVYGFGHIEYYKHVVNCMRGLESPIVDGLEGLKSVRLLNAIYKSIETKTWVKVTEIPGETPLEI